MTATQARLQADNALSKSIRQMRMEVHRIALRFGCKLNAVPLTRPLSRCQGVFAQPLQMQARYPHSPTRRTDHNPRIAAPALLAATPHPAIVLACLRV